MHAYSVDKNIRDKICSSDRGANAINDSFPQCTVLDIFYLRLHNVSTIYTIVPRDIMLICINVSLLR